MVMVVLRVRGCPPRIHTCTSFRQEHPAYCARIRSVSASLNPRHGTGGLASARVRRPWRWRGLRGRHRRETDGWPMTRDGPDLGPRAPERPARLGLIPTSALLALDRFVVEPDQLVRMSFTADRTSESLVHQFWIVGLWEGEVHTRRFYLSVAGKGLNRSGDRMVISRPVASLTARISVLERPRVDQRAGATSRSSVTRTTRSRPETLVW
jgi:hypothetical protein